jgi:excisionase family DNA binding protein
MTQIQPKTAGDAGLSSARALAAKWDSHSTFTVSEASEILGLSRWAAYQAVKNKELPVVWIGRRAIVPRLALERLLGATA